MMFAYLALLAALATPVPAPAPTLGPLPALKEIGRTRSVTPACAVMRDLTAPSFQAALRSDGRMRQAAPKLAEFERMNAGSFLDRRSTLGHSALNWDMDGPRRQWLLREVGSAASSMMQNNAEIAKALGDPRLAPTSTDPNVLEQRQALPALYAYQAARADLVWELQFRQSAGQGRDDADAAAESFRFLEKGSPQDTIPMPETEIQRLRLPHLSGIGDTDARTTQAWTADIGTVLLANERRVVSVLAPIAQNCLDAAQ